MTLDLEEARSRVRALERADASELLAQVEVLAKPRLTGSEGAADTEAALRERFQELGYDLEEMEFGFSTWPGRFGLPVSGVVLAITGAIGAWLITSGLPTAGLVILVLGFALALTPLLILTPMLRRLPFGRVETSNLLFKRPDSRPSWILMAHRDSKSQLVPTLVRVAAVVLGVLGWVALVVFAALWISGPPMTFQTGTWIAGAAVILAGLLLGLSWAGNTSPGALDNATGLAALLAVARRVEGGDVAFLLTDGEEMGLAGARDAAARLPPVQGVINVDGLDDDGVFYVAEGAGWQRKGSAPQLVAALLTAGRALDLPVQRRPLPRALQVDHLPLVTAGIPSVTLLRGRWGALMRVHRPADDPGHMDGTGAAEGATLLAAAIHLLRESGPHLAGGRRPGP